MRDFYALSLWKPDFLWSTHPEWRTPLCAGGCLSWECVLTKQTNKAGPKASGSYFSPPSAFLLYLIWRDPIPALTTPESEVSNLMANSGVVLALPSYENFWLLMLEEG